jgi:hypothetical protein
MTALSTKSEAPGYAADVVPHYDPCDGMVNSPRPGERPSLERGVSPETRPPATSCVTGASPSTPPAVPAMRHKAHIIPARSGGGIYTWL